MRLMRQTLRQVNRERVRATAAELARFGIDLLFPPLCVACGCRIAEPYGLCNTCWTGIAFIEAPVCERCGIPFELDPGEGTVCAGCYAAPNEFTRARSLFAYDDVSKELILPFKHGDRLERAPALAHWLRRAGPVLIEDADMIVPVPLHRWRLWRRRYNQSAVLAQRLAVAVGKIYAPDLLERVRATPSQGAMASAKARRRNVTAAFRVPKAKRDAIRGKKILLIDDVYTTGATLNACSRALKRGGAASVDALTLARVVRPAAGAI